MGDRQSVDLGLKQDEKKLFSKLAFSVVLGAMWDPSVRLTGILLRFPESL